MFWLKAKENKGEREGKLVAIMLKKSGTKPKTINNISCRAGGATSSKGFYS